MEVIRKLIWAWKLESTVLLTEMHSSGTNLRYVLGHVFSPFCDSNSHL